MTANLCCGNAFLWLIVVNPVWEGSQREMFISKPILINKLQEIKKKNWGGGVLQLHMSVSQISKQILL